MAISRRQVLETCQLLPVFPRIISEILHTIDDPNFNFNSLVRHVGHDPVLTGRVFSLANRAAANVHHDLQIKDLYKATSLVGVAKLQKMVILASMSNHFNDASEAGMPEEFWARSLVTGICAQHVAAFAGASTDTALIAGILHNVGKLWLLRFEPEAYREIPDMNEDAGTLPPCQIERERFGVDHAVIGSWLGEIWSLPGQICEAIRYYRDPNSANENPYADVVHVAEVIGNALDLARCSHAHVNYLSEASCQRLGLIWDESADDLFGSIEASIRLIDKELLFPHSAPGTG
ncbi:MAG: HDOD domain-containing protein [Burkholderiales bacterium]